MEKIERFRETLTRARPDVLVMVGSDHFHQLWLDKSAAVPVGKARFFDADFYNEEREFGLPGMTLRGRKICLPHPAKWAGPKLRPGVQQRAEIRPQHYLPDHHAEAAGRPADRADLHQTSLRRQLPGRLALSSWAGRSGSWWRAGPQELRWRSSALVTFARAGRPAAIRPHGPDPDFDRKAVEWIATPTCPGVWPRWGLDSLHAPGNATHGFMDFMPTTGVAGEKSPPMTWTTSTSSTPWRRTSPGIRTEYRHE